MDADHLHIRPDQYIWPHCIQHSITGSAKKDAHLGDEAHDGLEVRQRLLPSIDSHAACLDTIECLISQDRQETCLPCTGTPMSYSAQERFSASCLAMRHKQDNIEATAPTWSLQERA